MNKIPINDATYIELAERYIDRRRRLLPSEDCLNEMRETANAHALSDDRKNAGSPLAELERLIMAEAEAEFEARQRLAYFNASRVLNLHHYYRQVLQDEAPSLNELQEGLIHAEKLAEERRLKKIEAEGHTEIVEAIHQARVKPAGRPGARPERTAVIVGMLKAMRSSLWEKDHSEESRREKASIWADALAHTPRTLLDTPSAEPRELMERLRDFFLSPAVNDIDFKRLTADMKGLSLRQVRRHLAQVEARLDSGSKSDPTE